MIDWDQTLKTTKINHLDCFATLGDYKHVLQNRARQTRGASAGASFE